MKNCCDGDCNQGRDCPNRKESDFSALDGFFANNFGYVTIAVYVVIAFLLIVV